jgi:uncharacterized protein YndB with AHSA1/START domain
MNELPPTTPAFSLSRVVNAPGQIAFQAWTDPTHLGWFRNPASEAAILAEPIEVDLRVGGKWIVTMSTPEYPRYATGGIYLELNEPERIVFRWGAAGGWPEPTSEAPIVTVTLKDLAGGCEVTLEVALPTTLTEEQERSWLDSGMRDGWSDTLDRLVWQLDGPGR